MNAPIRVVCEGCLRSVELDSDPAPGQEAACPSCGRRLDSRHGEVETQLGARPGEAEALEEPETIDWDSAWTRGSLGSIGRFQLRERLGDGGFGQVYLAYDPRLDRDVALKVLKLPQPNDRIMERFFREARAVARLDHPNIVAVHDAGRDAGRCWVAYQLVSGRPLSWYRDRQRMDPVTAARIVRDLADALSHAHSMGVVHRDIKPGNVMIDDRGRARLIDFGLSRRSDVGSNLTRDGAIVGTPTYMSPEQAVGLSKQADERSDVYSLGVIFYELLCGRRPPELLDSSSAAGPGSPIAARTLPPLRSIERSVSRRLAAICHRAMSPRPSDRYPSARVMGEAIDAWLADRRHPTHRIAMGVLSLIGFVGLTLAAISVPRLVDRGGLAIHPTPRAESVPLVPPAPAGNVGVAAPRDNRPKPRPGVVVASTASYPKKFHDPDCPAADRIEAWNLVTFQSAQEAQKQGYEWCSRCDPAVTSKTQRSRQERKAGPPPSPSAR